MSRTAARSRARAAARLAAVQALYQHEMEGTTIAVLLHEFHHHRLGATVDEFGIVDADVPFFDDLVGGAAARGEEIERRKIGRAHVCTPVTNEQLVCRLLLEQKKY